jgi:chloramphenicol 3-O phosphotransferase
MPQRTGGPGDGIPFSCDGRARLPSAFRRLTEAWVVGVAVIAHELARGDRSIGLAALQAQHVHVGVDDDIEVDTIHVATDDCVRVIAAAMR